MRIKDKIKQSATVFKEFVWPNIKHWFGDGELIPVESVTEYEMAKKLDTLSSIDAWYVETRNGLRGIASRVQQGGDFGTFTIRYDRYTGARTEFEKLCNAISNDWLYPYWFIQSYVDVLDNPQILHNAASTRTIQLINYVRNGKKNIDWYLENTKIGDSTFCVIPWSKYIQKKGINILDKKIINCPIVSYSADQRLPKNNIITEFDWKKLVS